MNDKTNTARGPEDDLSGLSPGLGAEDCARLLAILREAYPSPKKDIRAAVMEVVRADLEKKNAGDRHRAAVLPGPAEKDRGRKRAARLGRIAKWGSLAACILLVSAVGIRVLPALTRKAAVMTQDSAAVESYPAEAASRTETQADANPALPAPAPEMMTEEAAFDEAPASPEAPAAAAKTSAVPEEKAEIEEEAAELDAYFDVAEEAEVPEAEDFAWSENDAFLNSSLYAAEAAAEPVPESPEVPRAVGDGYAGEFRTTGGIAAEESASLPFYYVQRDCPHANAYRNAYHDIPRVLIERVGVELFNEWAAEAQAADPCGVNLLAFALRFGLTAEEIYDTGDVWYYLDLPEDLPLTEESAEAVAAYYAAGGDRQKMTDRAAVYELKNAMIRESGLSAYLAWRGNAGGDRSLRSWTVREGADALGIGDDRLLALAKDASAAAAAANPGFAAPDAEALLSE